MRITRPVKIRWLYPLLLGASAISAAPAFAGIAHDAHGNIGYDTASECDAAVLAGSAHFYESYTSKPPLKHDGEVAVQVMRLRDVTVPDGNGHRTQPYSLGACDLGVGRSQERDGVAKELQGRYIPYSPDMLVNAYKDSTDTVVRVHMQLCDNWFGAPFPRPVPAPAPVVQAPPAPPPTPVPPPAPAPVQTYYYYAPPVVVYPPAYYVAPPYYGGYWGYGGGHYGRGGRH